MLTSLPAMMLLRSESRFGRFIMSPNAEPISPCGGTEDISTVAGASYCSRYFCTTMPPIE